MFVLPYVVYHTWTSIHYFWRDVTFCKQIAWESECFVCWYEYLLMVDVRLKIKALEPVLVWLDQSTVLYLDDAWWALVACKRDSGSSFFLLIICYSLWVSLHMITVIFYTIYWCLFLAVDDVLTFLKSIDASCGIWWIWSSVGWMHGWVCPWVWGCLAGVLPAWPQCHFLKTVNMSLWETRIFYIFKTKWVF